ncbi:MAG: hypothetical protein RLN99_10930, partial [Kiloniellaceae bacterium]
RSDPMTHFGVSADFWHHIPRGNYCFGITLAPYLHAHGERRGAVHDCTKIGSIAIPIMMAAYGKLMALPRRPAATGSLKGFCG